MDIQTLFAEIGKGGWFLDYKAVTSARVEGEEIVLVLADATEFRLPIDGKNRCVPRGHPEPEQIVVERPRMVRQQQRKVDGGGWHEVEKIGTHMVLANAGAAANNERWREGEVTRKREEAAQQHTESVSAFLSKQLQLAGNGRVAGMTQDGAALVIEFENGHRLFVNSFGRGDGYYSSVLIEGADTHTDEWGMEDRGVELVHHN